MGILIIDVFHQQYDVQKWIVHPPSLPLNFGAIFNLNTPVLTVDS